MAHSAAKILPPYIVRFSPLRDIWRIRYDFVQTKDIDGTDIVTYEETDCQGKPSIEKVKEIITSYFNTMTSEKILTGFLWKDKTVWLSAENQQNYTSMYLSVKAGGALPTIKVGDEENTEYYTFSSSEDVEAFYSSMLAYIQSCITEGWKKKDGVDYDNYV